jgi:hypothetical protein
MSITLANQFYGTMDHGGDYINPSPMVLSPRLKFKYTVTFLGFDEFAFPLKSVSIPDITFDSKVVQQYNIKRVVQQKINYGQATMTLVDTFDNRFTDSIYIPYVSNYYNSGKGISQPNISSQKSPVVAVKNNTEVILIPAPDPVPEFSTSLGYTAPLNSQRFNIPSIQITLDGGPNPKVYTLHNCFFVSINNDTLDYADSQPVMYTLTIQPELITLSTPLSDSISDSTQGGISGNINPAIPTDEENPFLVNLDTNSNTSTTLLDVVESQQDQSGENFNIS